MKVNMATRPRLYPSSVNESRQRLIRLMLLLGTTATWIVSRCFCSIWQDLMTRDSFGCGYNIVAPLIETIKGWNKHASVVWKQQMMLGVHCNWRGECKTMLSDDLGEKKKLWRKGLNLSMWASFRLRNIALKFFSPSSSFFSRINVCKKRLC